MLIKLLVGFFILLGCIESANASTVRSVSGVQIEIGEWTLVPTMEDSRVETILALRTSGNLTGDNIGAVWFQRGRNTWRVVAWESQDLKDAISFVKSDLGINDKHDSVWPVAGPFNVVNPPTPVDFANGLLTGDAMRGIVDTHSDPKELLEDLVDIGYRAAVIEIELVDIIYNCNEFAVFEVIAEGIEIELQQTTATFGEGETHAFNQIQTLACISFCIRWTWNGAPTLVGCTCTWGPSTGCEWNTLRCAMVCHFTGTSTCTYTRVQRRRTWSCNTCTWTETGTKTGQVLCTSTEYFVGPDGCTGNPGPGYVAPAGPDCNCPQPFGPITWVGAPPC